LARPAIQRILSRKNSAQKPAVCLRKGAITETVEKEIKTANKQVRETRSTKTANSNPKTAQDVSSKI